MSATLHEAYRLARHHYAIAAGYIPTADGCSCKTPCSKPGKHPIGGYEKSTTDAKVIRGWATSYPTGFNIGFDLKASKIIAVGADSPEWLAEFERRGFPPTITYQSGGGNGHVYHLYKRRDDGPVARICRSGEYDIMSDGFAVAPPSRHQSGRLYTWLTDELVNADELPEAPEWVLTMLREQEAKGEQRRAAAPLTPSASDEPPVRLSDYGRRLWQTAETADRSGALWQIGCLLDEANATEHTIAAALQDRDQRLGWNKYTDRPEWYAITAHNIVTRERHAQPIPVLEPDAPAEAQPASLCADQVAALQARIDQLEAENRNLREERRLIMAALRNPNMKAEKTTALATVFHIASAESRGQIDGEGFCRVPLAAIAENAGVSTQRAGAHIARLEATGIWEKQTRLVTSRIVEQATGLITERPHLEVFLHLKGSKLDALGRLAGLAPEPPAAHRWGGKREPFCPEHPDAGIVRHAHCAACNRLLTGDEDAPPLYTQDEGIGPEPTAADEAGVSLYQQTQDEGIGPQRRNDPATRRIKDTPEGFGECVTCGKLTSAGRAFCVACAAAPIDEEPPEPVFCVRPRCGMLPLNLDHGLCKTHLADAIALGKVAI